MELKNIFLTFFIYPGSAHGCDFFQLPERFAILKSRETSASGALKHRGVIW